MKDRKKLLLVMATTVLAILVGCGGPNNSSSSSVVDSATSEEVTSATTSAVATTTSQGAGSTTTVAPTTTTQTVTTVATTVHTHTYGAVTYEWNADNTKCTAKKVCTGDATHVVIVEGTVTNVVTAPTCEAAGYTTYTATFTGEGYTTQTKVVPGAAATGHAYGAVTYAWNEDNTKCTATKVCANDPTHVVTVEGTITSVIAVPTCETAGNITYTATFTGEGYTTQTKTVETAPATGHAYGAVTYVWNADYTECTAKKVCANNPAHVITVNGTVTREDINPTCDGDGEIKFTATFTEEGYETQVVTVKGDDATGHLYGNPTYAWNEDHTKCTATKVCLNDPTHVITEEGSITSVEVDPTCEEDGYTTYTATFTKEGFETQEDVVEGAAALGHDYGAPTYAWNEDNTKCTATKVCLNDTAHVVTEEVTVSPVVVDPTCEEDGYTEYTATFTKDGFETQTKKFVDADTATGHTPSDSYSVVDSETEGSVDLVVKCTVDEKVVSDVAATMVKKQGAAVVLDDTGAISTVAWTFDEETGEWHSNKPGNSSSSYIAFKVTKAGKLVINYRVSSEKNGDYLGIQIVGKTEQKFYGDSTDAYNEGIFEAEVTVGQIIKVRYYKDSSVDKGKDDAYISFGASEYTYNAMTFVSNGGTDCTPAFIENGVVLGDLPTPTKEGQYFEGWYMDAELTTAYVNQKFEGDAKLYAKWSDPFTVTYHTFDGDLEAPVTKFQGGTTPTVVEDYSRDGYYFLGWYTDATFEHAYVAEAKNASFDLYAKWIAVEDAHAMYGAYKGFYFNTGSYGDDVSISDTYVEFSVDTEGNYSLRTAWSEYVKGQITDIDAETGVITYTDPGSKIAYMYYDADSKGVLIGYKYSSSTIRHYVVSQNVETSSKTGVVASAINSKKEFFVSFPFGTDTKKLYINETTSEAYYDVEFKDAAGNVLDANKVANYNMIIKVVDGDIVLKTFYCTDSKAYATADADAYAGKYEAADGKIITVSGKGKAIFEVIGNTSMANYEEISTNELYVYYSSTLRYVVTLNPTDHTFTYQVRKITVTFDHNYEVEGVEKTETKEYVFDCWDDVDVVPTRTGYVFEGWYANAECTGDPVTRSKWSTPTTYYAKWSAAVTLTVHPNNGGETTVTNFSTGTKPTLPTLTKEGYLFAGWYTDEDLTIPYVEANSDTNVVVYAKWGIATFAGKYYGYNSDHDGTGYKGNDSRTLSTTVEFTSEGKVTGKWTTNFKITNYDETTNVLKMDNNYLVKFVTASDGQVFMFADFSGNANYVCDDDFNIYVKSATNLSSTSVQVETIYWLNGYKKIIKIAMGDKTYYFYTDGYNATTNPSGGLNVYVDITMEDFDGTAVSFDAFAATYNSTTKKFANGSYVIKSGSTEVAKFKVVDGVFKNDDLKSGTYTGTIDDVATTITLDGYGIASVKVGEADVVAGTYVIGPNNKVTVTYGEVTKDVTLGAESTYAQVLDGTEGSYSFDGKAFVFTGYGVCSVDGTAGTYTLVDDVITVTVGSETSKYLFDKTNKTLANGSAYEGTYVGYNCYSTATKTGTLGTTYACVVNFSGTGTSGKLNGYKIESVDENGHVTFSGTSKLGSMLVADDGRVFIITHYSGPNDDYVANDLAFMVMKMSDSEIISYSQVNIDGGYEVTVTVGTDTYTVVIMYNANTVSFKAE